MGHTNRHYHRFFRAISSRAHLYTEMIPSSRIVEAYRRARSELGYVGGDGKTTGSITPDAEEVMEVVGKVLDGAVGGSRRGGGSAMCSYGDGATTLSEMLRLSTIASSAGAVVIDRRVSLQLGGSDPETLAFASAVGAAFGYRSINLNCGCPSNAITRGDYTGRGGAALMMDPSRAARCVEAMSKAVAGVGGVAAGGEGVVARITVKHRIGVVEASEYDAEADHGNRDAGDGDDEAIRSCEAFVRAVTLGGAVSKVHVHARLGVLGEFDFRGGEGGSLWVPGQGNDADVTTESDYNGTTEAAVIGRKGQQYEARKFAAMRTKYNRNVPPLRTGVVDVVASRFLNVEFVTNGGIKSLSDVRGRIGSSSGGSGGRGAVMGAMVGRAVVNHPCSFAATDDLWVDRGSGEDGAGAGGSVGRRPTRGEVLREYVAYCDEEEERVSMLGTDARAIDMLRRQLVAEPFHLFTGEDGGDKFQRRARKLASRPVGRGRQSAGSVLSAATLEVPEETMRKLVDNYVPLGEVRRYDFSHRSGRLQRSIW